MASVLLIENAIVTKVNQSGAAAKTPALYVDIVAGDGGEFSLNASPTLAEKLYNAKMKAGDLTVSIKGRLFSGEKGSRQTLNLEDLIWSPVGTFEKQRAAAGGRGGAKE